MMEKKIARRRPKQIARVAPDARGDRAVRSPQGQDRPPGARAAEGAPRRPLLCVTGINPTRWRGKTVRPRSGSRRLCGGSAARPQHHPAAVDGPVFRRQGRGHGRRVFPGRADGEIIFISPAIFMPSRAAHNLLAALLDNHLYQGNKLGLTPRTSCGAAASI